MDRELCYAARKNKDEALEGKLYIGAWSRGVFCRVTCPDQLPEDPNDMVYFSNIYEALDKGLLPCPDCEPDLHSQQIILNKEVQNVVNNAIGLISEGYLNTNSVAQLARDLYISERHLRKLFDKEIGVSPTKIAIFHKAIFAKKLLYETDMSITDIAFASGFGSVRQFNNVFKAIFKVPPSAFRRENHISEGKGNVLFLYYTRPFDFEKILGSIKAKIIKGVEAVGNNCYSRTFFINNTVGHFTVKNNEEENRLEASIFSKDTICYMAIYNRIKRMFDLNTNFSYVKKVLHSYPVLERGMNNGGVPRLLLGFSPYEVTIEGILKQKISPQAAVAVIEKMVKKAGKTYKCDIEGLTHIYPDMNEINDIDLNELGIDSSSAETIRAVNDALINNEISLAYNQDYDRFYNNFIRIKGIDDKLVNYVAMRGLGMTDTFLAEDPGVSEAFEKSGNQLTSKEILELAEQWRPYRAYATLCMWNGL
jgi:AraC family transcriptional regulator of adaptative response / DNA-3-methyladenine glycosylase II